MDTLKENIDKIIEITESENIRHEITMKLADYIVQIKQDSFDDGNDKMFKAAMETLKK